MPEEREQLSMRLSAYLDGELPPEQAHRLSAALERDEKLRAELKGLKATRALLKALPREQAPAELLSVVMAQVERDRLLNAAAVARPAHPLRWVRHLATAAIVVLSVGLGAYTYYSLSRPGWDARQAANNQIASRSDQPLAKDDKYKAGADGNLNDIGKGIRMQKEEPIPAPPALAENKDELNGATLAYANRPGGVPAPTLAPMKAGPPGGSAEGLGGFGGGGVGGAGYRAGGTDAAARPAAVSKDGDGIAPAPSPAAPGPGMAGNTSSTEVRGKFADASRGGPPSGPGEPFYLHGQMAVPTASHLVLNTLDPELTNQKVGRILEANGIVPMGLEAGQGVSQPARPTQIMARLNSALVTREDNGNMIITEAYVSDEQVPKIVREVEALADAGVVVLNQADDYKVRQLGASPGRTAMVGGRGGRGGRGLAAEESELAYATAEPARQVAPEMPRGQIAKGMTPPPASMAPPSPSAIPAPADPAMAAGGRPGPAAARMAPPAPATPAPAASTPPPAAPREIMAKGEHDQITVSIPRPDFGGGRTAAPTTSPASQPAALPIRLADASKQEAIDGMAKSLAEVTGQEGTSRNSRGPEAGAAMGIQRGLPGPAEGGGVLTEGDRRQQTQAKPQVDMLPGQTSAGYAATTQPAAQAGWPEKMASNNSLYSSTVQQLKDMWARRDQNTLTQRNRAAGEPASQVAGQVESDREALKGQARQGLGLKENELSAQQQQPPMGRLTRLVITVQRPNAVNQAPVMRAGELQRAEPPPAGPSDAAAPASLPAR